MKCRKCANRAVLNMRQHKLALCKEHFVEWFLQQTERTVEKYGMFNREARILVAVSGGKDSLSLWDALHRLGYAADGIYIDLGIEALRYSSLSREYAEDFARQRSLRLHVVGVKQQHLFSVPELAWQAGRSDVRPCAQCGLVKRYVLNKAAAEGGYTALATGHNLDDEAAVLLGNALRWSQDLLPRQTPVLEASGGFVRKVKPLCRFYERETAAYAVVQGIPYVEEECPYSEGNKALAYKTLLNQIEDHSAGSKLAFYLTFLNARRDGFFRLPVMDKEGGQMTCAHCGQPTTTDICAFCRLIEGAEKRNAGAEQQ